MGKEEPKGVHRRDGKAQCRACLERVKELLLFWFRLFLKTCEVQFHDWEKMEGKLGKGNTREPIIIRPGTLELGADCEDVNEA